MTEKKARHQIKKQDAQKAYNMMVDAYMIKAERKEELRSAENPQILEVRKNLETEMDILSSCIDAMQGNYVFLSLHTK